MPRALVVNCSGPHYNLATHKLQDWLTEEGWDVTLAEASQSVFQAARETYRLTIGQDTQTLPYLDSGAQSLTLLEPTAGYDRVCLSVIFSWHAPLALDLARRAREHAEVWSGGPGLSALQSWWKEQTGGLEATKGVDWRFERQRSRKAGYEWGFFSRGCPVNCYFCVVPRIEGTSFTLDWEAPPVPKLADNNLSALPLDFQEHIIRRYQETGMRLIDANSGFEPRTFDSGTFHRWSALIRGKARWRFAFDEQKEAEDVARMMLHTPLKTLPAGRKRVYVLIGNEPIESCLERARNVIDWGGEPYVQPVRRLNVLRDHDYWIRYDWTPRKLRDFARYFNCPELWRTIPIHDYQPRKSGPPAFPELRP